MEVTPKLRAWSISRLNCFEQCAKKDYHLNVVKDVKDKDNVHTKRGTEVHDCMKHRLRDQRPLPEKYAQYEWAARTIEKATGLGLYEQQVALDDALHLCEWFAKNTYIRVILDVAKVTRDVMWIGDYKTGKIKEQNDQLMLFAGVGFIMYPRVQKIITSYIWLDHNHLTNETWTRESQREIWNCLIPRARIRETAIKHDMFNATTSRLCSYCPVLRQGMCPTAAAAGYKPKD